MLNTASPLPADTARSTVAARPAPKAAQKPRAAFVVAESLFERIYGPDQRAAVAAMTDLNPQLLTPECWRDHPDVTRDVEWIFSTWSMPRATEEFLAAFPRLRTIFYAAGTVKTFATDALWERGIIVTSALAANAVPVAEFTVAQVVLALKSVWPMALQIRQTRVFPLPEIPTPGVFHSTVGLISLGSIGRLVAEYLGRYDLDVLAYDPYVSEADARQLGVRLCGLDELFTRSDVVSCHAPLIDETHRLVRQHHIESMKPHATFINTARGAIVDEPGLLAALRRRPDLFALLDVTSPEPPPPDSPIFDVPNLILTPHIAGSTNLECRRMADYMIEEAARLLAGEPLRHVVTADDLARRA